MCEFCDSLDEKRNPSSKPATPPAVKPIRPEQISKAKAERIPDEVVTIFNELITKAWNGTSAVVQQTEAGSMVAASLGISLREAYDSHLLDVEEVFREAGWNVEYDKPAPDEHYDPRFIFTKRK